MSQFWKDVWTALHIVSKTYEPQRENVIESYKCIFDCLTILLPESNYRNNLYSYIEQTNFYNTTLNGGDPKNVENTAFLWSYKLHNYINFIYNNQNKGVDKKVMPTLEEVMKKYSNINKTMWGNSIWIMMHFIAANLPSNSLTREEKISFKAFIVCIRYLLPCEECRNHMNSFLEEVSLDDFLNTGLDVFTWTWNFHNNVNKRLGKNFTNTLEERDRLYTIYRIKKEEYEMIDFP